ncbi:hypothetical protein VNO78_06701 [Psophocarpus tetragonolobus]|uniref:NAC domain-containing protein n=1 Tax=Psophocarpus tetragonolobus TaxID=3891 RepID=A0AAN9SUK1_PSOTE
MEFDDDFNNKDNHECMEDDEGPLPGFRFHPTDEELVAFYLQRKLDNKPISLELIKQIDIYKYDPWDLPKASGSGGENEWYFFCKRGRKYKNSIRPNRVTCSGCWKATRIDKSVYSVGGDCIGLKKTLVYYHGSAGKGTKTNWMMHEFRLPSNTHINISQDAEIWTLCRILKRNVSHRKYTLDLRQEKMTKMKSEEFNNNGEEYIKFSTSLGHYYNDYKPVISHNNIRSDKRHYDNLNSQVPQQPQITTLPSSNFWINPPTNNNFSTFENWDELGSIVKFPSS